MTIKWVKSDPLVMNGEPFCYGSRITVRQLLQERRNGAGVAELIKNHPELKTMGIAAAYAYAAGNRARYAEFFEADGSLAGQVVFNRDRSRILSEFNTSDSAEDWDERHTVINPDGSSKRVGKKRGRKTKVRIQ